MDGPLSLPVEVSIWRYLDVTSLCTASLVCRSWHALSSDNLLWREVCMREIKGLEWTPRMLARPHKSWKRHFGVRLRASVDHPIRRSLRDVVPRLLDDAHARGATAETIQLTFILYCDRLGSRFVLHHKLPHGIRHESSPKRRVAVMAPNGTHELAEEVAKLEGVDYVDTDAIWAFKKNRRTIKHWARNYVCLLAHSDLHRQIARRMGPHLYRMRKVLFMLPDDTPLATAIEEQLRTAHIYVSRYRPDVAVGNVGMSAQELIDNVMTCVSALLAALPERLKAIQLHATRGPAFTIPGPPLPNQPSGKGSPKRKVFP